MKADVERSLLKLGSMIKTSAKEEILNEDFWGKVIKKNMPEAKGVDYVYYQSKRETVVVIVVDRASGDYIMRNEGTLASNFAPTPKFVTGTVEDDDKDLFATVSREVKEELGQKVDQAGTYFLGTLAGSFNELHPYYMYLCIVDYKNAVPSGDGSAGESKSSTLKVRLADLNGMKDMVSLAALGTFFQKIVALKGIPKAGLDAETKELGEFLKTNKVKV